MRETHQGDAIVAYSGNPCLLAKEDDETGLLIILFLVYSIGTV